jgi:hypothetical protein
MKVRLYGDKQDTVTTPRSYIIDVGSIYLVRLLVTPYSAFSLLTSPLWSLEQPLTRDLDSRHLCLCLCNQHHHIMTTHGVGAFESRLDRLDHPLAQITSPGG